MKIMKYSIEHQVAAIGYEVIAVLLAAQYDRFSARLADTNTMPWVNLGGTCYNRKF